MSEPEALLAGFKTDSLTVIALSMLAYTLGVSLHEHLDNTLACILLGGHPTEVGAYYPFCDYGRMSGLSIRLVALADNKSSENSIIGNIDGGEHEHERTYPGGDGRAVWELECAVEQSGG